MALKRITRELADLQRNPPKTYYAGSVEACNLQQWVGHIYGPPDTPYEQRDFSVAIVFPENYPRIAFQLTSKTPVFHPNVSEEGDVRLAELEGKDWTPALTVRSILLCLQALLSDPHPLKGVSNSEAARVCLTNKEEFKKKTSYWSRK
jgi:ubiquitin-conjugating enzyme E2 D/E